MTGNPWKPPHLTAQQRRKRRSPIDAAQLAPVQRVAPVVCADCGCPRLIHRDNGPCLRVGCSCESYVEVRGD